MNVIQAALFSDKLGAVLGRYHARQVSSAEVIRQLVELAKEVRAAQRRNQELGLSDEETAFYDAISGGPTVGIEADPTLAEIARDLVGEIRADLEVDWTSREALQADIRRKIKRLLLKHRYRPPAYPPGNGAALSIDEITLRSPHAGAPALRGVAGGLRPS